MSSYTAAVEPMLAGSMRVLRNITTVEDLIAAWPSLREKGLLSPPTLADTERRQLLDLPNEDMEASNIRAVTCLSRERLIEKALSDPERLTHEEAALLRDRFWAPHTGEEDSAIFRAMAKTSPEGLDEYFDSIETAYVPGEEAAFGIGSKECWKREQAPEKEKLRAAATLALPHAKKWIQYLYQQDKTNWGFVCLYDAAAQQLDPARLDSFSRRMGAFFRHALMCNGSKDIINLKWRLLSFNTPTTGFAPTSLVSHNATIGIDYQDGAVLRKAFQTILTDPQGYQKAKDVNPPCWGNIDTQQFENGIAGSGLLTNTFLVIDPVCIDSALKDPLVQRWDNMRILAFEADFPVQGREYEEGYQGFTSVRMDQLIFNFYELRLLKADEIGMDKIWKAAQESRAKTFVSMDLGEDYLTTSSSMLGFTRDSVVGKYWYATRDDRK